MSLERDLGVLETLTTPEARRRGSLSVTRVAALAGMDKSVVSRALKALEREGVVLRDEDTHGYRLGWRLPMLILTTEVSAVLRLAHRAMHELAEAFPETIQSFVILRSERVFLPYNLSAGGAFRDQPWSARGWPSYCTAPGRALLSDRTLPELRRTFPSGLDLEETPHSRIRSLEDLAKLLATVREQGFATSDGEFKPDLAGASAPIRDHTGTIVAAINVSGLRLPENARSRSRELHEAGRVVGKTVATVSHELGWIPFPVG